MSDLIDNISKNFHFLRPELLWALVPVFILALMLFKKTSSEDKWKKNLPDHLVQYLIVKGKENSRLPRVMMILMLLISVFAVAGPTWKEIDRGEVKSKSSLIIALDLSRSMLATDLQPNRLDRAKEKIIDLLNERPGMPAALVGFAGSAHTILHFTSDYNTLRYLLEHVSPKVMPLEGTNFKSLFELTDSLFKPMETPGAILIITDDLPAENFNLVKQASQNSKNKIEFLLTATPGGSPIPISKNAFLKDDKGRTVTTGLNTNAIPNFAKLKNVNVNLITLDDSDVKMILSNIKENLEFEKKENEENIEWEDYGYWFIIPAAILLLFWSRKGWIVSWIILIYIMPYYGCSNNIESGNSKNKFEFVDLWLTNDQQGQRLFDEANYMKAAEKYENLYWKGVSYYKAKEFQMAAQIFYRIKNPQGYFNLGMCMAELENWDEAIYAFQEALKINPDFREAEYNIEEIKKLIPKKKKMELVTPQSLEDKMFGKSEELDQESDEKGDIEEKNETGGEQSKDQSGLAQETNEQFSLPEVSEQEQQKQEQKDILLKQMSDDPAVFLARKFAMQYKKNAKKYERQKSKW